jgi:hypothetical protein
MATRTFTDQLRITVAALQVEKPEKADAISRAHAAIVNGHVLPCGDGTGKVLSDNLSTWYTVNGTCICPAASYDRHCKHATAWGLYKFVQKEFTKYQDTLIPQPDAIPDVPVEPLPTTIPAQYLVRIHGKPFVLYTGLLAMAHDAGLVKLEVRFVSVTETLAVAEARAEFRDGRVFVEAGDATPENVGAQITPHFARMALTRAKARALRDAMNVGICSREEME